jgi:hypothetical protein
MPVDQFQLTADANLTVGNNGVCQAQSFVPLRGGVVGISFYKQASLGSPVGNFVISIRADNANKPAAASLATVSLTLAQYNALSTGFNFIPITYAVTAGTKYWLVFNDSVADIGKYYSISRNSAGGYASGDHASSTDSGATWTVNAGLDLAFMTWYPTNQIIITG